jgi:small nuclear ribonucleoprotein (snRNP)-like protein
MLRRWMLGFVVVGLLASALLAKQGIVVTRDGDKFTGDVTETDKFVTVTLHGVQTTIDKRNVANIEYTKTIDDQFNDRRTKLANDDVKGRIDLANWASQNQRPDLAVQILLEARKIDPMNQDAARLLEAAQQQVDMAAKAASAPDKNAPAPHTNPAQESAPPAIGPGKTPPVRRLLNNDEINIIRQQELLPDDKVRVQFNNDVIKEYLGNGDHDAAAFRNLTPVAQAIEIFTSGNAKLAKQVRILTDPPPLLEFRQKLYPMISSGCAASGCHGGTHAGNFGLYTGDSTSAIYSNFYTLMTYAKTINGTQYLMLDRTLPDRSLFLEFSLPAAQADVAHPDVPNYRPRMRTKSDAPYAAMLDWLTNSLKPIPPDYHIDVSAKLPAKAP